MEARAMTASRRDFLTASLAMTVISAGQFGRSAGVSAAPAGSVDAAVAVTPRRHDLMRVRIEMDVKGNVTVSQNPLVNRNVNQKFPIDSTATLDYEERPLVPPGASKSTEVIASQRYYHEASSESVLNKTSSKRELRPEMRVALVRRETLPETVYSADHYFTHDELALLKSPVSSLSVDRLLPAEAVLAGDRYRVSDEALCSMLNLSSVDAGEVESTVTEVSEQAVRFQIEGELEGSVDGVNTRLRLLGKMTFDRREQTCTWLALAIHETRDIGRAEPGFDVSATIKMVRRPLDGPKGLPAEPPQVDLLADIPRDRMYVELRSRFVAVGTMLDRRWRMINDRPGAAILRMIEHDISIAQCNLRPLVELPADKPLTLERFQSGVRTTLGDKLRRLVEGDQRTSAQGLTVLRVVADGETKGVPIRWIMMHFADEAGRRVQATFTMSADQIEAFAGSDVQLAESLRFLQLPTQPTETPDDPRGVTMESAAADGSPSRVAQARPLRDSDSDRSSADRDQPPVSASDLQ